MSAGRRLCVVVVIGLAVFIGGQAPVSLAPPGLTAVEIAALIQHGPWPVRIERDASNRLSGSEVAAQFGKALFFDPQLSINGTVSCASCHKPELGWSDGRSTGRGLGNLERNSQSLLNVADNRWFGWAGDSDSLWSRSISPLLDRREMGATPAHLRSRLAANPAYAAPYQTLFNKDTDSGSDDHLLVNLGKVLAAFQETIRSPRTAFDDFRDALARGDTVAAVRYPEDARRGAALFVGRGKCSLCHFGPSFSNGEFASVGILHFTGPTSVDQGRYAGIAHVKASRFNRLGPHNDATDDARAWAVRHVEQRSGNFGEFRVPSLRNIKLTAPYMHNGSKASLEEVVRHYSEIDLDRLHADGERILEPLNLTDGEIGDLVAFLKTL